jgi:excisionase family DNA binding protein
MSTRITPPTNRDERLRLLKSRQWELRSTPATPAQLPRLAPGGVQGSPERLLGATSSSEPTELTKRLLTLDETAKILRVGRTTVWEMVTAGELSAVRLRGKLLIPREELDRYLAELIEDARATAEARRSVRRKPSTLAGRRR